jgi:hypothetical protein
MQNYIVANRANMQVKCSEHFAACLRANKPCVTIATKRRFSAVELDMFTTCCNLDDTAQDQMLTLLRSQSEPDAWITWSSLVCRTDKIRSEVAAKVAAQLFRLAEKAMRRRLVSTGA